MAKGGILTPACAFTENDQEDLIDSGFYEEKTSSTPIISESDTQED